jgi:hypothetical protein
MSGNTHYSTINGDRQTTDVAFFPSEAVVRELTETAKAWQFLLSGDRPLYDCPDCIQRAMQFYPTHPSHPGRRAFFLCHACKGLWEI